MAEAFGEVGLVDTHRLVSPDLVADPAYTANHQLNPLCVHWGGDSTSRSKIDYFFTRGVTPATSGVHTDFSVPLGTPAAASSTPPLLPVSDHYPIFMTFT
jgi:hypothetical protein